MAGLRVAFENLPPVTCTCGCNGWSTQRYILTLPDASQVVVRVIGSTVRDTAHLLRSLEDFGDLIIAATDREFILTESEGTVTLVPAD